MSFNSFGHIFRVTTWGESHGPAIGATIDGCPPGVKLSEEKIQIWLDRRAPGRSIFTSQRKEPDKIKFLSGIFEGKSTGTPIQILIENKDQKSKDYSDIKEKFRPGHADITYFLKYGLRDYRGGGRSSARETACRVAAGGVAKLVLNELFPKLQIIGYMVQMGSKKINRKNFSLDQINLNPFFCPDVIAAEEWSSYLTRLRKSGDSAGGIVEIIARNVPAGIGAPIYAKLDAEIASAMMSINAVKGVEIGEGMNVTNLKGSENSDEIFAEKGKIKFKSNFAGGILGGISTGQDIVTRFSVKPTSSILKPKKTISTSGGPTEIITKGRHDPCVGIRAVPVGESMLACVLLDHILLHRGQNGFNQVEII